MGIFRALLISRPVLRWGPLSSSGVSSPHGSSLSSASDFLQRRSPDGSQKFAMNENTNSHPQPCRPATPEELSRRRFFEKISIGLGALCTAILGVPLVGFVLAPLFRATPTQWIPLGKVDDFEIGKTVTVGFKDPSPLPWAGITANSAAWLRRERKRIYRIFRQLHPPRLSRPLAGRCGAFHVPVPRRCLLQGRIGRRRSSATPAFPLRNPR